MSLHDLSLKTLAIIIIIIAAGALIVFAIAGFKARNLLLQA